MQKEEANMKWSMLEIRKYKIEPLRFVEKLDLKKEIITRFSDFIIDISPLDIKGFLEYKDGDVYVHANVSGTMIVPSSRSLKPVDFALDFMIDEFYTTEEGHLERYEDTDAVIVLENDVLDFDEAIIEYVVLQLPLQILAEDEVLDNDLPAGNGWEVVTEEQLDAQKAENQTIDPRLAKLKDLFPDQD